MIDLEYPKKLLELGDKDGAIKELARLLRQQPQNVNAWFLLAQALDDKDRKADCYRQVLRVDPDNLIAQDFLRNLISPPLVTKPDVQHNKQNARDKVVTKVHKPVVSRRRKSKLPRVYIPLIICFVIISCVLLIAIPIGFLLLSNHGDSKNVAPTATMRKLQPTWTPEKKTLPTNTPEPVLPTVAPLYRGPARKYAPLSNDGMPSDFSSYDVDEYDVVGGSFYKIKFGPSSGQPDRIQWVRFVIYLGDTEINTMGTYSEFRDELSVDTVDYHYSWADTNDSRFDESGQYSAIHTDNINRGMVGRLIQKRNLIILVELVGYGSGNRDITEILKPQISRYVDLLIGKIP
jgi:hypothetical protein